METNSISPKEFMTHAEQKFGKNVSRLLKAVLFGLGGLALWITGPAILAFLTLLTSILGQLIVVLGLMGVVFALYMLVTNSWVRTLLRDQFDGFIRSLIKEGVKVNPIARLEAYADEHLQGKMNIVRGVKDFIKGKQNWHKDQVESKSAELKSLIEQATVLRKRSCLNEQTGEWKNTEDGQQDRVEFRVFSDQITLLKDSLARFEKMGKRYELFMALLQKYERAFDISIRKTRNTVKVVTDEYEASQNMTEATQAMSGVMEETDQRTQLFNMTLEYVAQEIGNNVAQIENFFDRTRSIINSADLQSDVAEERLLRELSDMDIKTDQAIATLESHQVTSTQDMVSRVQGASSATVATQVSATMPSGDNKYAELRKKIRRN